ncbi:MAG: cyclic nucleotide-binding domain-containing protein [Pseudomonadota bacterium]
MKIKEMSFFEGIDNDVIQKIQQNCTQKIFDKGKSVFEKGESANFLYFLETGEIDLFLKEKNRSICILNLPGEVFGWSSIVENGVYTSSAICKVQTSVLRIPREAIKEIFNQHPKAAVTFYQRIGNVFSKRLTTVID